jgi:serine/threonine protein kinase
VIGSVQEGRYKILHKLGEGGQGEVYLAEHLHLGRREALKVLRSVYSDDESFVSRFRREARATNRVQHPNIVGVYDFGKLPDGRYFLAMEYVDGERLDAVIGGAPLPVRRALRIASQLARALAHAHALGVVHRDLKPANLILITRRAQADFLKVLDFGMAKIVEPEAADGNVVKTLDGQMFGTAPYMAPEQFLERGADPRMDVYAAGCILYEMLTGAPPFSGGMVALMDQHLRHKADPPSRRQPAAGIPPLLDALVMRCLAKRPEERFADAGALAEAIDAVSAAATAAEADRTARRPKLGVPVPRAPNDFGDDFADEYGAETDGGPSTEPGELGNRASFRTEPMNREDATEVAGALLQEVGDALLDVGATDAQLVAGMAQLRVLRSEIARIRGEAAEIEERVAAVEQSMREREASLSFAIGELKFDRDQGSPTVTEELAIQINALERSLAALHAESTRTLTGLDDQALGLAARLHDAEAAHASTCRRLEQVITPFVDRLGDGPPAPTLRQRMATVRALFKVT